jgi:hypothetical protein
MTIIPSLPDNSDINPMALEIMKSILSYIHNNNSIIESKAKFGYYLEGKKNSS